MAELTKLSSTHHADWRVARDCGLKVAANQHIINIKVTEIGRAVSNFPIFLTKMSESGNWGISAMTSLEINKNLFINDGLWSATYMPTALQTYPFFLMQSDQDKKKFTVGIEESNPAFSTDEGDRLFEDDNKASVLLSTITATLEDELKADVHSYQFTKMLNELELITPISVRVQYENGSVNALQGLYTVDEAKLQDLPIEQFEEMRKKGYLPAVYGLLMSIYQLNGLISRHNGVEGADRVNQVKLETNKGKDAASV